MSNFLRLAALPSSSGMLTAHESIYSRSPLIEMVSVFEMAHSNARKLRSRHEYDVRVELRDDSAARELESQLAATRGDARRRLVRTRSREAPRVSLTEGLETRVEG